MRRRTASCVTISVLLAGFAAAELQTSGAAIAAPCPTPQSGAWIGTWVSSVFGISGAAEADLAFTGPVASGTMTLTTGTSALLPGDPVSGSVSCDTFSGLAGPASLTGTISPDGTEIVGTYDLGGIDSGTFLAGFATQIVSTNGTSLTTDSGSTGATPTDPVQASITSPNAGPLSIGKADPAGATLSGYVVLGQVVRIVAPPATAANPLSFTFEMASSLTGGAPASSLAIFRNGVLIVDCTGPAGVASPDPCVSSRVDLPNGNAQITALSSAASVWAVGVLPVLIASSATPATVGQTITITATAASSTTSSASPKGSVRFYDGATLIATKPVKAGVAKLTTKKLAVGTHAISATFTERRTTPPVTSSVLTQQVDPATTQTTLISPVNPSKQGRTASFKVTVVRVAPGVGKVTGGTITFFDDGTPLATIVATNGKATYKTTSLTVGSHPITATYDGSGTDLPSSSAAAITQTVT